MRPYRAQLKFQLGLIETPAWLFGNVVYETTKVAKQRVYDHGTLKAVALLQAVIDTLYDVVFSPIDGPDLRPGQNAWQPIMQLRGSPAVSIGNIIWSTDTPHVLAKCPRRRIKG